MFERFDESGRKSVVHARAEAVRLGHEFIDTEHMLLGVLKQGGEVIDLLKSLSVEPEAICREVEKRHGPSSDPVVPGQLPFSPWAKNALLLAAKEAGSDGWIHSGHLLLGLLLESRGIAGQVLRDLELDPAELRKRY